LEQPISNARASREIFSPTTPGRKLSRMPLMKFYRQNNAREVSRHADNLYYLTTPASLVQTTQK
jgi:hypothetical protein